MKYTSPIRDHICFCQETQSIAAHQTHPQFSTHRVIDCRDGIGLANHVLSIRTLCEGVMYQKLCTPNSTRAVFDCRDGIGLANHVLSCTPARCTVRRSTLCTVYQKMCICSPCVDVYNEMCLAHCGAVLMCFQSFEKIAFD